MSEIRIVSISGIRPVSKILRYRQEKLTTLYNRIKTVPVSWLTGVYNEMMPVQCNHCDGEGGQEGEEQGQEVGQGAQRIRQRKLPMLGY